MKKALAVVVLLALGIAMCAAFSDLSLEATGIAGLFLMATTTALAIATLASK